MSRMWHCRIPAHSCKILYSSGISLGNLQYILISPCLPFHIWQPQKWNHLLIIRMHWSTDLRPSTRPLAKDNKKNEKNSILLSLFPLSPFSAWERHHLKKDDHSILKARREKITFCHLLDLLALSALKTNSEVFSCRVPSLCSISVGKQTSVQVPVLGNRKDKAIHLYFLAEGSFWWKYPYSRHIYYYKYLSNLCQCPETLTESEVLWTCTQIQRKKPFFSTKILFFKWIVTEAGETGRGAMSCTAAQWEGKIFPDVDWWYFHGSGNHDNTYSMRIWLTCVLLDSTTAISSKYIYF